MCSCCSGFFQWDGPTEHGPLKAFPPSGDNPQGRGQFSHFAGGAVGPGEYQAVFVVPGAQPQFLPVPNSDFAVQGMGGVYVLTVGLGDSVLADGQPASCFSL